MSPSFACIWLTPPHPTQDFAGLCAQAQDWVREWLRLHENPAVADVCVEERDGGRQQPPTHLAPLRFLALAAARAPLQQSRPLMWGRLHRARVLLRPHSVPGQPLYLRRAMFRNIQLRWLQSFIGSIN
jgi:hypothetical protein